jgi:catechol 2,3-dioxygenase-like lactoylglutathione lyase family enzyme
MDRIGVRYIVNDVDAAIAFYTQQLGFELEAHPAPGFAALQRGGLRLLVNAPGTGGAGQAAGGVSPAPGGWNRFQIEVDDVDAEHARLQAAGVRTRGGVINGKGGRQLIVEDPAGNAIELFEPAAH